MVSNSKLKKAEKIEKNADRIFVDREGNYVVRYFINNTTNPIEIHKIRGEGDDILEIIEITKDPDERIEYYERTHTEIDLSADAETQKKQYIIGALNED